MILGLGGLDHNGAACLVEDGRVVVMLELERVTRRKNQGLDSPEALTALLDRLGAARPVHVAIADRTWFATAASWLAPRFADWPPSVHAHHACHLAAAFVASPLERATVVAVDGKGDGLSASAGHATRSDPPSIDLAVPSAHSLGRLWWAASEYAGLPGHHAAGKTMALAAYGEAAYLDRLLRHRRIHPDGGFRMESGDEHPDLFRQVPRLIEWMTKVTGEPQAAPRRPGRAHMDMAASVQQLTERVVEDLVGAAVARTRCRDVCLAGGVALNGLVNLEIKRREPFRPFGCSILREHVGAWFEGFGGDNEGSPYMLRIVRARPDRRSAIAAALHVDGTSRLHTVDRAGTPRLARLLELMIERGHPPLLINTSLNGPGEPIVHTATQAFATARDLGLDHLVVEGALYSPDLSPDLLAAPGAP